MFVMLLQLALTVVMTVKMFAASDSDEVRDFLKWTQYFLLVNAAATFAMLVGVVRAIPELARARVDIGGMVIAAAGFAIATAALVWSYWVFSNFVELAFDPNTTLDALESSVEDLKSLKVVVIVKDLGYTAGLITLIRTVQRSAAANDQLALRDLAGSMSRALIVMLVSDLFYQLTYGQGGSVGLLGAIGALLVAIYWIYCHVRLAKFLYNAAYFVNEPHNLPVATVVKRDGDKSDKVAAAQPVARPSQSMPRPARPSQPPPERPSQPAPIVIVPPRQHAEAPRATSSSGNDDADGPWFLR